MTETEVCRECGEPATHRWRRLYFCLEHMTEYAKNHRVGLVLRLRNAD